MAVRAANPLDIPVGQRARRSIIMRVMPYLFLLYIIAFLDRVNVGFAELHMKGALGFSDAVFGFGKGVFFIGYFLLEIPGTLIVERWSARKWIARIMVTWGIFAVLMAPSGRVAVLQASAFFSDSQRPGSFRNHGHLSIGSGTRIGQGSRRFIGPADIATDRRAGVRLILNYALAD
jgi:hypothetical protein